MDMKCKVVMNPGIYVIDGGVLDLTDNKSHVTGNGVMFLLRNGAQVKIGGSGGGGVVNLSPLEAADFVTPGPFRWARHFPILLKTRGHSIG
jgi:hypothetical protein